MLNVKKLLTHLMTTESTTPTKVGSTWSSGSIELYRKGGAVTLKFGGAVIGNVSSRTNIATIPEGYRPAVQIVENIYGGLTVIVNTDGRLQVDPSAGATYYGNLTYTT